MVCRKRKLIIGAFFAILSTISYGLTRAAIRRGVQGIPAMAGIHITTFVGIPLLVVATIVTGQIANLSDISGRGYILLGSAGLTHLLVGRYCTYRCFAAIGTNRGSPIMSVSVPFTLLAAVLVLGERVSMINGVGIGVVVLAPIIMFHGKQITDSVNPSRLREGYTFGLITALAFGCSPLRIREAIGNTGMGVGGALVAYGAAAVPLLFGLALPGRRASLHGMDRTALRWFLLTTVTTFFAQMFSFVALDCAPVTVVAPLMRTTAVWMVIFAFLINRQLEPFGPNVLAAIALSVIGSIFVVL